MGNGNGFDTFLQGLAGIVLLILAAILVQGGAVSQTIAWVFGLIAAIVLVVVIVKIFTIEGGKPGLNSFMVFVTALVLLLLVAWIGFGGIVAIVVSWVFLIAAALLLAWVVFRIFTNN